MPRSTPSGASSPGGGSGSGGSNGGGSNPGAGGLVVDSSGVHIGAPSFAGFQDATNSFFQQANAANATQAKQYQDYLNQYNQYASGIANSLRSAAPTGMYGIPQQQTVQRAASQYLPAAGYGAYGAYGGGGYQNRPSGQPEIAGPPTPDFVPGFTGGVNAPQSYAYQYNNGQPITAGQMQQGNPSAWNYGYDPNKVQYGSYDNSQPSGYGAPSIYGGPGIVDRTPIQLGNGYFSEASGWVSDPASQYQPGPTTYYTDENNAWHYSDGYTYNPFPWTYGGESPPSSYYDY